ncbi:VOC family protein [Rhodococcus sp. NPDC058521]|uniref:VOC family protein n=1 Tax=Rhodococcus sp. NPDC058521 TaxID=3346536 RepID=UPI00365F9EF2
MSEISTNQPLGTPTWLDLGIPDLDRAMSFYGPLFGWEFDVGSEETGRYTMCRMRGKDVAALMPNPDPAAKKFWWNVYLATDDVDATMDRIGKAGGKVVVDAMDVMNFGRMAVVVDPSGGQFCLWQGKDHVGCELVNEPGALLRNDLVTPDPGPAREFYASVFDFTLDGNDDMAGVDFTFLRRPDGHEIGGIMGIPDAPSSSWGTLFQVEDADRAVAIAREKGGEADDPYDMQYGRMAEIRDPFGATFSVGSPLNT